MVIPAPLRAEAEVMHKAMTSGRNKSVLLGCRTASGATVDCVVKFAACLAGMAPLTYLVEWCAVCFGRLLGVTVPDAFEVMITPAFAASLDSPWRELAAKSLGSAFGSEHRAGGFTQWLPGTLIPMDQREAALTLLAFDVLIHNPDRRIDNPNVLASRTELLAIDHDAAFSFLFSLSQADPAEEALLAEVVDRHVFAKGLGRSIPSLERFKEAVAALSDEQFEAIAQAAPAAWQKGIAEGKLGRILEVMLKRRDAIDRWLPQVEMRVQG